MTEQPHQPPIEQLEQPAEVLQNAGEISPEVAAAAGELMLNPTVKVEPVVSLADRSRQDDKRLSVRDILKKRGVLRVLDPLPTDQVETDRIHTDPESWQGRLTGITRRALFENLNRQPAIRARRLRVRAVGERLGVADSRTRQVRGGRPRTTG